MMSSSIVQPYKVALTSGTPASLVAGSGTMTVTRGVRIAVDPSAASTVTINVGTDASSTITLTAALGWPIQQGSPQVIPASDLPNKNTSDLEAIANATVDVWVWPMNG